MAHPNGDVAFGVPEATAPKGCTGNFDSTDTITFNSSNKIAFISNMLSFNEKMLEYLRGMDLIIIEVPHPNSLYASNVKSNIDNEEIKVDTYEEYEIFINKVHNIVNVACRLGENSITLCVPDKNNSKPYCVKFVMDRTHDLSYMNFRSSLNMYGELVLYKNLYIKNVKYALEYNKNCIDNKKFYNCLECCYTTPTKYTMDHNVVDKWRELKYIDFFNKLHYKSSAESFYAS